MASLVDSKVIFLAEAFATFQTCMTFLPSVRPPMADEVAFSVETLATVCTHVWLLPRVNAFMIGKEGAGAKTLPAL